MRPRPKTGYTIGPALSLAPSLEANRILTRPRSTGSLRPTRRIEKEIFSGKSLCGWPVSSSGGSWSDFSIFARVVWRICAAASSASF